MITEKIEELKSLIPEMKRDSGQIDVKQLLSALLHNDSWSDKDIDFLKGFLKKVDISKQLRTGYLTNWKQLNQASTLTEPWLSITTLLLCKLINDEKNNGAQSQLLIKRMNTLFKLLDITTESWLAQGSPIRNIIEEDFKKLVARIPFDSNKPSFQPNITLPSSSKTKTTIPLTILFWEGPIARAYLATIHALGFAPEKIIHLVSGLDISTGKTVARWLPLILRKYYASNIQKVRINYWPKYISKNFLILRKAILDKINTNLGFDNFTLEEANKPKDLAFYSNNIETLLVYGLNDPVIHEKLSSFTDMAILYTGGGILPESLLSIPKIRFIHIHPGFLPEIRGADCVLWSVLLTGQPSATCFYMSPGIDTGDVIFPCWLPKVSFPINGKDYSMGTLYQAVFSFIDPWVRSYALRHVLIKFGEFNNMPSTPQELTSGTTYHYMHPALMKYSFQSLFL